MLRNHKKIHNSNNFFVLFVDFMANMCCTLILLFIPLLMKEKVADFHIEKLEEETKRKDFEHGRDVEEFEKHKENHKDVLSGLTRENSDLAGQLKGALGRAKNAEEALANFPRPTPTPPANPTPNPSPDPKIAFKHYVDSQAVDVIILVDGSASIKLSLEKLKEALIVMPQTFAVASPHFQIGILVYRDRVVQRFPLQQIKPNYADHGASVIKLRTFVEVIRPISSKANTKAALEEAMQMLNISSSHKSKQLIVLLGDVGMRELYSAKEQEVMVKKMRSWARDSRQHDRRVLALLSRTSFTMPRDTMFYRSLGMANSNSKFSTSINDIYLLTTNAVYSK